LHALLVRSRFRCGSGPRGYVTFVTKARRRVSRLERTGIENAVEHEVEEIRIWHYAIWQLLPAAPALTAPGSTAGHAESCALWRSTSLRCREGKVPGPSSVSWSAASQHRLRVPSG